MHPPPRSSPTEERSHQCIYIYLSKVDGGEAIREAPHYSDCSVCPPIYIHIPPLTLYETSRFSPQPSSRTFPHAPPSPPVTPQPGGTCLCLPANWRVLTNPNMRSRGHLSVPRAPRVLPPRDDIAAPAGGATPNACQPRCPPLNPPRPSAPRRLANSPGPANWLPPPGGLAPAPIWAGTRPRRPFGPELGDWGLAGGRGLVEDHGG